MDFAWTAESNGPQTWHTPKACNGESEQVRLLVVENDAPN